MLPAVTLLKRKNEQRAGRAGRCYILNGSFEGDGSLAGKYTDMRVPSPTLVFTCNSPR
jgi:hypothetical protein